ncbi:hypothetical protein EJ05DRAFT_436111 [Pseudovirgaria hyperparasitica]|uniref:Integral membrane protein n=1 Tax=Pseudovirgaria hyperparasitica TaxID=470096 RepID=A0A6A6WCS6_9PEZI|nr:uncharacterized protein EJ05DRAFT_436111 [Pseudovirgaria hyperparasitica]KAF2760375.1 hypothetical protein EJ05DRAFT_436111 [Pseudovirgaria hyperparasitica]
MPTVAEGASLGQTDTNTQYAAVNQGVSGNGPSVTIEDTDIGRSRSNTAGNGGRSFFGFRRGAKKEKAATDEDDRYEHDVVDMLDVIDPEVSTLSTLTNVQNSLFVPDLGRLVNRRPTYTLRRRATAATDPETDTDDDRKPVRPDYADTLGRTVSRIMYPNEQDQQEDQTTLGPNLTRTHTSASISSQLTDSHYAVLPHGVDLEGWSQDDKDQLNDRVRHMLHSRRSKFKRSMKGFGQYVRRPLGFLVTLYATLITLFGLAWVLFLIGWIYVPDNQVYVVHIIDSVLVALFAIMGDGLAPFRAVDTYHMIFIAHYHHLTWKLRQKKKLPDLQDHNDLPSQRVDNVDLEKVDEDTPEFSVLKPEQQKKLDHHAYKFARSHTFYKPHETDTHHAFPLRLLIAIVVLLDCHSLLQISLGATTWGIYYKDRPFAITTVILCCSITCNVTAGILISVGDHRSRKKDVVERMFRQTLTEEAMARMAHKKKREEKEARERFDREQLEYEATEGAEAERRAAVVRAHEKLAQEKKKKEEEEKEEEKRHWEERKEEFKDRFRPSTDDHKRSRASMDERRTRPSMDEKRSSKALDRGESSVPSSPTTPVTAKVRQSLDERIGADQEGKWQASKEKYGVSRKSLDGANKLWKPASK